MMNLTVKIKKLDPNAVVPVYAKPGDAGLDLTSTSRTVVSSYEEDYIEYGTGLAVEIPEGYVGLVFPRSSISKKEMSLANSVGVIDSGYRGEIKLRFKAEIFHDGVVKEETDSITYALPFGGDTYLNVYAVGDKVGQLIIMPYPQVTLQEVEELSDTSRGDGGFGSTGK